MHKPLLLSLALLPLLAPVSAARPARELPPILAEPTGADDRAPRGLAPLGGAVGNDTIWFGGTTWAADSLRWEALRDSLWTFDTGVASAFGNTGPNKPAGYHTLMEGWSGLDQTLQTLPYFRRTTECAISGASFWAGVTQQEANALCYASGRGYGNNWIMTISKAFNYSGGSTTLQYDYAVEAEPGFDYSYAVIDTSGGGSAADLVLAAYTGNVAGHATINLAAGTTLPRGPYPKSVRIKFRVTSDGGYSDQDGNYPTNCGHSAFDNIQVGAPLGGTTDGFDLGDNGWAQDTPTTGVGDYTNIVSLADLPPPVTFCPCAHRDSVLVFFDTLGEHPLDQNNLAVSPWIDLRRSGDTGMPGKIARFDLYWNSPLANYVYYNFSARWYPAVCPATGKLYRTPFQEFPTFFEFDFTTVCSPIGSPRIRDVSDFIPPGAEQIQLAVAVYNLCRTAPFGVPCSGLSNTTPWFDNIAFGTYGTGAAPSVYIQTFDLLQDNFAADGSLNPASTVAVDTNRIKGFSNPAPGSALADTLVVSGDGGNTEVRVVFHLRPGPFTNVPALNAYGTGHYWRAEPAIGAGWYSCRMDTAERAGTKQAQRWMGTVHESEAGGALAGGDRRADPSNPNQLYWEILPDNILTPGSRIDYFVESRFIPPDPRDPGGNNWFIYPDTTGGYFLEWEALPSSMAADSTWNCRLLVNHHADRDFTGQRVEALGLTTALGTGGHNAEGTRFDRFDCQTPSSGQLSFGRPIQTSYGCAISQVFGYRAMIWHSGSLSSLQLTQEDANIVGPWLTMENVYGQRRFWGTGDGLVTSMNGSGQPSAVSFMRNILGVTRACNTIRDVNCPSGTALDSTYCLPLAAGASAAFAPSLPARVRGNGCPELRSFDLIGVNAAVPTAVGNLVYTKDGASREFASASNDVTGNAAYRTVVDGFAAGQLRSNAGFWSSGCNDITAALDRTADVLGWFGTPTLCRVPLGISSTPEPPAPGSGQPVMALGRAYPNPAPRGATRIQFVNAAEGGRVRIVLFDVTGRLVRTLCDAPFSAGPHAVEWDGRSDGGAAVASGLYFYRMTDGAGFNATRKMILIR